MSFLAQVEEGAPLEALAQTADALGPPELLGLLSGLTPRHLSALYALAGGGIRPAELTFFIPPHTPAGHTVAWEGINSLFAFRRFQKRFIRGPDPYALIGHNQNSAFNTFFVGPGYFVAMPRPGYPSEFLFDYTQYPTQAPTGWPRVKDNRRGTARFAFGGLNDYFRPVGMNLGVGATYKQSGKFGGQYFALVRGASFLAGNS
jgi:hypothetical protein